MQQFNGANEKLRQWIKTQHYRLHCVEGWADSPYKEAVLASIHSALNGRKAEGLEPFEPMQCMVCAARRKESTVLMFPSRSKGSAATTRLAA